ncbi:hypothetical protein NYT34_10050 [Staphylococcus aureus]|nr:hypothetical protein [Staphylococcus aureus]
MTELSNIINSINQLYEAESECKISKNEGVPYQKVEDLRNGKINLEDARFRTIIKLYN